MNKFQGFTKEKKIGVWWALSLLIPLFANAQYIDSVNMVNHLVIGDDPSKPIDYSLGKPVDVSVDSNDNIFIADQGTMTLKVFNKSGKYLRSIGQRGKGPGEFLSLKEVSMTPGNDLLISDRSLLRITKFNTQGELLGSIKINGKAKGIFFSSQIVQLSDGQNLILYKDARPGVKNDKIFHLWNSSFNELLQEFGSYSEINFQNKFGKAVGLLTLGSFYMNDLDEIIFAPSIYQGRIFKFNKKKALWFTSGKFSGYNLPFSPTVSYADNLTRDEMMEKGAIEMANPQGRFKGNIRVTSAGIFSLENGDTAHFIFIKKQKGKNEGKWELGVEIFDNDLSYKGYFPLKIFNKLFSKVEPAVKAKDVHNNFYMISQEGYPVVRKFTLDIHYVN